MRWALPSSPPTGSHLYPPKRAWSANGLPLTITHERRYVSSAVSSRAILGALLGGVGALVLAGLVASLANAELSAVTLLTVGGLGAVGVGAMAGFIGGSTLDQPAASGPAAGSWPKISVECEDEQQLESAIEILREKGPLELYRGEEQLL